MKSFKKLFFLFVLVLSGIISFSDLYCQSIIWRQIIGESRNDEGWDVIELKDNGFLMVGDKQILIPGTNFLTMQTFLVKLDKYGNILWQKTLGDSINGNNCYSVTEDVLGNIYLPYNSGGGHLIKMNSDGDILWDVNFSGLNIAYFTGISHTENSNNLVILGQNQINSISTTASLTKVDSNGNVILNKLYYDSIPSFNYYLTQRNSYFVSENYFFICGSRGANAFIIKADTLGNRIWTKIFTQVKGIYSIARNSENTFISTGEARNFATYCLKFNNNGDTIWTKNYRISDDIYLGTSGIVNTFNGKFALGTICGENQTRMAIIDSLGNIEKIFQNIYPSNIATCQNTINSTSDSGFVFTGYYTDFSQNSLLSSSLDALIYKVDKNGNTVFIKNNIINFSDRFNFVLHPNPFNLSFKINFNLQNNSKVRLTLFDVSGRKVREIENNNLNSGEHQYLVNTPELSSGVYFINVSVNEKIYTKKIILIK